MTLDQDTETLLALMLMETISFVTSSLIDIILNALNFWPWQDLVT